MGGASPRLGLSHPNRWPFPDLHKRKELCPAWAIILLELFVGGVTQIMGISHNHCSGSSRLATETGYFSPFEKIRTYLNLEHLSPKEMDYRKLCLVVFSLSMVSINPHPFWASVPTLHTSPIPTQESWDTPPPALWAGKVRIVLMEFSEESTQLGNAMNHVVINLHLYHESHPA